MAMELTPFLEHLGYVGILIGTFFEGETILVIAGFLAHQDYLGLPGVISAAFAGAMLGDQLYFHIGRWKGRDFIAARPALEQRRQRVSALLGKHQTGLILGFRFVYGIRTVTPFVLGASAVSPLRFFFLNAAGALAWAIVIGSAGFYFGAALEKLLGRVKDYELLVIAGLLAVAISLWLYRRRGASRR